LKVDDETNEEKLDYDLVKEALPDIVITQDDFETLCWRFEQKNKVLAKERKLPKRKYVRRKRKQNDVIDVPEDQEENSEKE